MIVHGDHFIFISKKKGRDQTLKMLQSKFDIKHHTAGSLGGMDRELRVLGRIAICHGWGWSLEADPCLIEGAVQKLGLEEAKGISTPGQKCDASDGAIDIRSRRMGPRPLDDPNGA